MSPQPPSRCFEGPCHKSCRSGEQKARSLEPERTCAKNARFAFTTGHPVRFGAEFGFKIKKQVANKRKNIIPIGKSVDFREINKLNFMNPVDKEDLVITNPKLLQRVAAENSLLFIPFGIFTAFMGVTMTLKNTVLT